MAPPPMSLLKSATTRRISPTPHSPTVGGIATYRKFSGRDDRKALSSIGKPDATHLARPTPSRDNEDELGVSARPAVASILRDIVALKVRLPKCMGKAAAVPYHIFRDAD